MNEWVSEFNVPSTAMVIHIKTEEACDQTHDPWLITRYHTTEASVNYY